MEPLSLNLSFLVALFFGSPPVVPVEAAEEDAGFVDAVAEFFDDAGDDGPL